ncbi:hypothetical protein B4086_5673 [Bacillus cereus]|nr:hypothetical protein B4086_5673 [Bacillus cereus]
MSYVPFEDSKQMGFGFYVLDDAVEVQARDTFYLLPNEVKEIVKAKDKRTYHSRLPLTTDNPNSWFEVTDAGIQIKQTFVGGVSQMVYMPHAWLKQIALELQKRVPFRKN